MTKPTLTEAYAGALAVYSPGVAFDEWTLLEVPSGKGGWSPYVIEGDRLSYTEKSLSSSRWIYVFRRERNKATAPAVLVDELHVDAKGQISATPMEAMRAETKNDTWPEREYVQADAGATHLSRDEQWTL
ncbi:MAG: hypothetical protein ACRELB_11670, partial [Polyangiaceae bacterium]